LVWHMVLMQTGFSTPPMSPWGNPWSPIIGFCTLTTDN
jgi:hypothetical protein